MSELINQINLTVHPIICARDAEAQYETGKSASGRGGAAAKNAACKRRHISQEHTGGWKHQCAF
eukprot:1822798-Amphidinium_carterae.1